MNNPNIFVNKKSILLKEKELLNQEYHNLGVRQKEIEVRQREIVNELLKIQKEEESCLNNLTKNSFLSKRINCQIDEGLLTKCQSFLSIVHQARDYTYSSVSDSIRKSLIAYQEGKLDLTISRPVSSLKKTVGFLLPSNLVKFHQSLPSRHRTEIIEQCLSNYLEQLLKFLDKKPLKSLKYSETLFPKKQLRANHG